MDWKKYRKTQAFKERRKNIYRQVLREIGPITKENEERWKARFKELEKQA